MKHHLKKIRVRDRKGAVCSWHTKQWDEKLGFGGNSCFKDATCTVEGKPYCDEHGMLIQAEVPVSWRYNVTTIDPPELIAFMRQHHRDVEWVYNEHGHMLNRAVEMKGFPTKRSRVAKGLRVKG